MKDKILDLEKKLFKIKYIHDDQWMNQILHDNFFECGKSGYFFDKQDTIEGLKVCTEDREIKIYNFECQNIDENTYLIHYLTESAEDMIYRTSIWVVENGLQLLFHQATRLNQPMAIKRF